MPRSSPPSLTRTAGRRISQASISICNTPPGGTPPAPIKFAQGYDRPAPRDFVGEAPLTVPEAAALAAFTEALDPALVLAYHTQGNVIYWKYLNFEPEGSRALAERFAAVSGYACEDTPYASGFAGYKDWFIQNFDRPGYTIECGLGENPLPLSQFESIWNANLGILTLAALGDINGSDSHRLFRGGSRCVYQKSISYSKNRRDSLRASLTSDALPAIFNAFKAASIFTASFSLIPEELLSFRVYFK